MLLTDRQMCLLDMISYGRLISDIAQDLGCPVTVVQENLHMIKKTLGVKSIFRAVEAYIKWVDKVD